MLARDLDYFVRIAETGSLRRTATLAGVSQPAVTKGLRRLESELGLVLVERSRAGASLTESGRAFLERARWLRREIDVALQHATDLRASALGLLRIGMTPALVEPLFRPTGLMLMAQRPAVSFRLVVGLSDELLAALRRGDLDLVLSGIPPTPMSDLQVIPIGENELKVVAREKHPIFRRKRLRLADLGREKWMLPRRGVLARDWLDEVFSAEGLPPPVARIEFSPSHDALLPMVLETDLLSVAGESVCRRMEADGLRAVDLARVRWRRPVAVLTRTDARLSPIATRFIQLLRENAAR
jgi:DNA-binding transcriptional LysR family regulator